MIDIKSKSDIKPKKRGRPICQYHESEWKPKRIVTTCGGSEVGITIDDHCFVVLSTDGKGQWNPSNHIPSVAAKLIGQLNDNGLLEY